SVPAMRLSCSGFCRMVPAVGSAACVGAGSPTTSIATVQRVRFMGLPDVGLALRAGILVQGEVIVAAGAAMGKKKKVRVDLRKNRAKPARPNQWTRQFQAHGFEEEATHGGERVRAKGDMSRRRTIILGESHEADQTTMPTVDPAVSRPGRVLRVHGLGSIVEAEDGRLFRCAVRRLLKSLVTDERN